MTMEIDINKYLTKQQMTEIASRIFIEKVTANVDDMINRKEIYGRGFFNEAYTAIVEKYAGQINNKYKGRIEKRYKRKWNVLSHTIQTTTIRWSCP